MKTKIVLALLISISIFGIVSCGSTPEIPEDMTTAQLLQAGQNAASLMNYSAAEQYFMAAITRNYSDTSVYVEARYELGCVYLKQKKYDKARLVFEEIESIYDESPYGSLPPAFQKLAALKLSQIPEGK